jgi:hypothetical protein
MNITKIHVRARKAKLTTQPTKGTVTQPAKHAATHSATNVYKSSRNYGKQANGQASFFPNSNQKKRKKDTHAPSKTQTPTHHASFFCF